MVEEKPRQGNRQENHHLVHPHPLDRVDLKWEKRHAEGGKGGRRQIKEAAAQIVNQRDSPQAEQSQKGPNRRLTLPQQGSEMKEQCDSQFNLSSAVGQLAPTQQRL